MDALNHLVVCAVGDQRIGVPVEMVERVVQAVAITPLPGTPECVLGIINFQGRVIPVIDVRKRYDLPARDIQLSDKMVIAGASDRQVALLVDSAEVIDCAPEEITPVSDIVAGAPWVHELVKREEGIILVYDLNMLLSRDEQRMLNNVLGTEAPSHA